MSDPKPLTDAERNAIARELVDEALKISPAVESPIAFLTAGQPGAGKTSIVNTISVQYEGRDGRPISINPDDVRPTLPYMRERVAKGDIDIPDVAYSDAGMIAAAMMRFAAKERRNIIYDGTLSNTIYARQNVEHLKIQGYQVEIHGMAVTPDLSHASTYNRREREIDEHPTHFGRGVPDYFHDQAVSGLVKTIDTLQADQEVDAIVLYSREEVVAATRLENGHWVPDVKMSEVLQNVHEHPDTQSLRDAASTWERASEMMRERGAGPIEQSKVDAFRDAARDRVGQEIAEPAAHDISEGIMLDGKRQELEAMNAETADVDAATIVQGYRDFVAGVSPVAQVHAKDDWQAVNWRRPAPFEIVAGNELFVPGYDCDGIVQGGVFYDQNREPRIETDLDQSHLFIPWNGLDDLDAAEVLYLTRSADEAAQVNTHQDLPHKMAVVIPLMRHAPDVVPVVEELRVRFPSRPLVVSADGQDKGRLTELGCMVMEDVFTQHGLAPVSSTDTQREAIELACGDAVKLAANTLDAEAGTIARGPSVVVQSEAVEQDIVTREVPGWNDLPVARSAPPPSIGSGRSRGGR